ncbi:MAG TPA: SRPBCC domain-containing protein [Candidatus Eisenbacteria bacterium]|nr:SRPBCC domain-containing protein [Candidatus Eisenbacteria bacterium]
MPTQKDSSGRRFIVVETEVPGTPEEVWQAIATGPGITAWFVPTQLEEREKGSISMNFGPGMESKAEIQEWDPPRRFSARNEEGIAPGSPAMATEWTVEAKAGGTCRVRVVHSWFASTDDWDKQFESVESGWPAFFRILSRYLAHFRGQPCTQIQLMAMSPEPREKVWAELARGLGITEATVGQAAKSSGDAPRFAAVIEHAGQKADPELMLRLEEPAPGTAQLALMPMGGQMCVYLCLYLYGEGARSVATREAPVWQAWLARLFPAPVGQPGS